jgi:hypothetical protein
VNGRALYIEIDEYCRAWLRNLIVADLICPGDVVGDGKARPIESGTFPLAHGQSNRVGRLRAYGNAMHRAKITQFILASQEAIGGAS